MAAFIRLKNNGSQEIHINTERIDLITKVGNNSYSVYIGGSDEPVTLPLDQGATLLAFIKDSSDQFQG